MDVGRWKFQPIPLWNYWEINFVSIGRTTTFSCSVRELYSQGCDASPRCSFRNDELLPGFHPQLSAHFGDCLSWKVLPHPRFPYFWQPTSNYWSVWRYKRPVSLPLFGIIQNGSPSSEVLKEGQLKPYLGWYHNSTSPFGPILLSPSCFYRCCF